MSRSGSRSLVVQEDEGLRLPRAPGVIRQFWARQPLLTDIVVAAVCLFLTIVPAGVIGPSQGTSITVLVPIVAGAACVMLVWRRRWPVLALIAAFVASAAYLLVSIPVGGPLLVVACYTLAVHRSSRAGWWGLAIGVGSLSVLVLSLWLAMPDTVTLQVALNAIIGESVVGLIGTLIGVNVGNRRRYLDAVIARSRQLLLERDQRAQLAAAAERARIAREMHDIVSHSLTVVVALSEGATATKDPERARAATEAAAATARDALTEMRAMLGVLREDSESTLLAPEMPTPPSDTVAAAQRAGFPVTLSIVGEATAPPPVRFAIGRIVQEGVTNAMRHAPRAGFIRVVVDYAASPLRVEIRNDGVAGAAGASGATGFGLRGIAERVLHVGGAFSVGPQAGGLWVLTAEIPLRPDVGALA